VLARAVVAGPSSRSPPDPGGGLLVTPAFGIGGRLLALIESHPRAARRSGSCLVARRGRIAFLSRGERSKEVYLVNADGSGQRRLTGDARFPAIACLVA
jgi:hypothetical protein